MRVTIVAIGGERFDVHAVGCADLARTRAYRRRDRERWDTEAESVLEIVEDIAGDVLATRRARGDNEWSDYLDGWVNVKPCVRLPRG